MFAKYENFLQTHNVCELCELFKKEKKEEQNWCEQHNVCCINEKCFIPYVHFNPLKTLKPEPWNIYQKVVS